MSKAKNLLTSLAKDYPPTSPSQTIKIQIPQNKKDKIPEMDIAFLVNYDGKVSEVEHAYVTLSHRDQNNLKEYPLSDIGVYIYYNQSKEVAAILFKSILAPEDQQVDEDLLKELEDFLESIADENAIQAYRACAYYWCSLEAGFKMLSGDIIIDFPMGQE